MINYLRQVALCKSVQEEIKRALTQNVDIGGRLKLNTIPSTESILRAASLRPDIDTEEGFKELVTEHVLESLRLTPIQKEDFRVNMG